MNTPHRARCALATALLVCAVAPAAQAQRQPAIPEVRVGGSVSGSITAADPAFTDRGPFKVYRFQAREGDRYVATLRSPDFDAFLTLMRPVGGITEALRSDDDSGGGTDARMRFRVPATGTYYLVAQSLAEEGAGAFTLALELAPAPAPVVPRPIALGQSTSGVLTETDPILDEDDWEVHYHLYTLQARAGQQLLIAMQSDAFDTFLAFGPMAGGELELTDFDDDGGDGTNSRLRVTIPADGVYGIQARAFGPGQWGGYTLSVREFVQPPVATRPIRAGAEVNAALTADDASNAEGAYIQHWTYTGRAGERLSIRMRSDEFDTYVHLGRMVGGTFQEIASNDDAADEDGTNSHLEVVLPAAGEYVIRATSFSANTTGGYALRVDSPR